MAQDLGYAEKDPTADVEGHDACRKICILASIAFGKHVYPNYVHTEGITSISAADVEYADSWGGKVKLIGKAEKLENGKVLAMVHPAFVPCDNLLADITDVFNGVMVFGDAIDRVMFYGRGAGKFPTASAVVADLIDVIKLSSPSISQTWEDCTDPNYVEDYTVCQTSLYVRATFSDKETAQSAISATFGKTAFLCRENAPENEIAFITSKMPENSLRQKLSELPIDIQNTIRILDI